MREKQPETMSYTVEPAAPSDKADAFGRRLYVYKAPTQTETWDTMPKSGRKPVNINPLEVGRYQRQPKGKK